MLLLWTWWSLVCCSSKPSCIIVFLLWRIIVRWCLLLAVNGRGCMTANMPFFFSPNVLHAFFVGVQWQWYVECCWDGCFQWMRWCSRATRSFLPSPRCSWPVLWNWKLAPGCCWSEWDPEGIYHASCFVLAAQLARDHAGIESSWWTFLQTSVLLISLVRWVLSHEWIAEWFFFWIFPREVPASYFPVGDS